MTFETRSIKPLVTALFALFAMDSYALSGNRQDIDTARNTQAAAAQESERIQNQADADGTGGTAWHETKWQFSLGATGFFAPTSAYKSGSTHVAPIEKWNFPLAVPDASVSFTANLFSDGGFSPLTIDLAANLTLGGLNESASVTYRPKLFPLISFSVGGLFPEGWGDTGAYRAESAEYDKNAPFRNILCQPYGKAALLLPLGSVLVTLSYQAGYTALTGVPDSDLWQFGGSGNQFNGWTHGVGFAALRLSKSRVNLAGLLVGAGGYLSDGGLDERYRDFDPTFTTVSIVPLVNVQLGKKDNLCFLSLLANRRSFSAAHEKSEEEPLLSVSGSEWVWGGIFVRYVHTFR